MVKKKKNIKGRMRMMRKEEEEEEEELLNQLLLLLKVLVVRQLVKIGYVLNVVHYFVVDMPMVMLNCTTKILRKRGQFWQAPPKITVEEVNQKKDIV